MNQKCIKRRFGVSGHRTEEDVIPNTLYMKTKSWWILRDFKRFTEKTLFVESKL